MADHRPEVTPYWSACVGAAGAHDAMFPDVDEDNTHADAINCIAYYGITLGKGDGSYGPDDNVTALHMRLFVQRAADLMGADGEAVLGGVELSDTVTRLEMAQLMFGLLDDMLDWVRINSDGDIEFDRDENNVWQGVNDYFADARAEIPIAESDLIGATYELGVVLGRSANVSTDDSVFAPSDPVTRAQMASFITRTLDHSNVRPAGLAAQRNKGVAGDDPETQVSYRDADFQPIEDARLDAFSSVYPDDALDDDGECVGRFIRDEIESDDACEISLLDEITDDDGNAIFVLNSDVAPVALECTTDGGETVTFKFKSAGGPTERTTWVWTGDLDDEFDGDVDDDNVAQVEDVNRPVAGDPPDHAHITGGLPTGDELAKMGETVTFTVQIRTGGDDPQATGPDRSGNPYHLRITKHYVASSATEGTADTATDGPITEVPGFWNYLNAQANQDGTRDNSTTASGAQFQTPFDSLVWPNGDGEFSITLTNMDLDAAANNTDVAVRFALTPFLIGNDLIDPNLLSSVTAKANHADGNSLPANPAATGYVVFSDDPSSATSVTGESAASYRMVDSDGTGNSLTVTVTDQYGDPLRNIGVTVDSDLDVAESDDDMARYPESVDDTVEDDEDGTDVSSSLSTRRNGTYRIGYSYTGTTAQTETVDVNIPQVVGDDPSTADVVETDFELQARVPATDTDDDEVTVYFARVGSSAESHTTAGGDPESVQVLVPDVSRRILVVNEGEDTGDNPQVYYYDEEDNFRVGDVPATIEMFEEALAATLKDDKIRPDRVLWESYDFNQPRDRAIWELTMSCDPRE